MTTIDAPVSATERARAANLRRRALAEARWSTVTIWLGVVIVVGIPLLSLLAPLLGYGHPARPNYAAVLQPPSVTYPFGTDQLGRDVFAQVCAATPIDYEVGIITTVIPLAIGLVLGAVSGYFGGAVDSVIMRVVDVVIAFPFLVFVLAFVAVFGPGLAGIYVGLIAFDWAFFARVTRGEMLVAREREFMTAAATLGLPTRRILLRHALPNVLRPNIVVAMATIVLNILTLAGLSYLGLGVQPPRFEWGAIVASGQTYLLSAWWISTLPGLVIVLAGVGFSLIGDGIADRLGYDFRLTV